MAKLFVDHYLYFRSTSSSKQFSSKQPKGYAFMTYLNETRRETSG